MLRGTLAVENQGQFRAVAALLAAVFLTSCQLQIIQAESGLEVAGGSVDSRGSGDSVYTMTFSVAPSSTAVAGASLTTQPEVSFIDADGAIVDFDGDTVSMAAFQDSACTVPASGTLNGNTGVASDGVAAFSGLSYTKAESVYLKATSGSYSACSGKVDVSPAAAAKLGFAIFPSATADAGAAFATQPVVQVQDAYGNVVTAATNTITLDAHVYSSCGGRGFYDLRNNSTAASSGEASFAGVDYVRAETIWLRASASGLAAACTSGSVAVQPNTPSSLKITGPDHVGTSSCSGRYRVNVLDGEGNLKPVSTATTVNLEANTGSSVVFYDDAGCTNPVTAVNIAAGESGADFYTLDTASESAALTATDVGLSLSSEGLVTDFSIGPPSALELRLGSLHSCAGVDGGVKCWGDNRYGQLGDGTNTSRVSLAWVQSLGSGSGVTDFDSNEGSHACAVVGGGVLCWGANGYGQLGNNTYDNSNIPVQVSGIGPGSSATRVATGWNHSCAVVNEGLKCWGYNYYGEVGKDRSLQTFIRTPHEVLPAGSGVVEVAAGERHTCYTRTDGTVWCFGDNYYRQLGDGTNVGSFTPVQVVGLTGPVSKLNLGRLHSCIVDNDSANCWGDSNSGQRVDIAGPGVTEVAAGQRFTCVLRNGEVKCYGPYAAKYLGNGGTTTGTTAVGLASGVQRIWAGKEHACAMKDDQILCWGTGAYGILGNGAIQDSNVPLPTIRLR